MINPYRLWSLWDMLKKYSTIFGRLMVSLFDWEMDLYSRTIDDTEKNLNVSEDNKKSLNHHLTIATNMADELGLDAVAPLCERIWPKLKTDYEYSNTDAYKDISDLRSRIEDQVKGRYFLFVAPSRVSYYGGNELFGAEVPAKFPKAIDDIEDAGKCLAVGQGTATVMHLMRVLEEGLKTLARGLGIPYAPSWESYLSQIQDKIAAKHNTKDAQWLKDEKYYRDVSGDLLTVKQAWRNPTMHIDRRYSPEEAEQIFGSVRALMQRLAQMP